MATWADLIPAHGISSRRDRTTLGASLGQFVLGNHRRRQTISAKLKRASSSTGRPA
jgi:hypothetical protein